jgi:hypothetical protein
MGIPPQLMDTTVCYAAGEWKIENVKLLFFSRTQDTCNAFGAAGNTTKGQGLAHSPRRHMEPMRDAGGGNEGIATVHKPTTLMQGTDFLSVLVELLLRDGGLRI